MEDIDLNPSSSRGEEDDAISYGDVTVRRSHVSKKDRSALVDLQLSLQSLRGVTFGTESPVASSQLPNVEEYKVQSAYTGGSKKKGPSTMRAFLHEYGEAMFMGVMLILILIGSFLVGSVFLSDQVNSDGTLATSPGADNPGGGDSSNTGHTVQPDDERFTHLVDFISGEGWTSRAKLSDQGSPQMRAATWLADIDPQQLPIANTVALRERYALAVLHYATNGRDWARDVGFLSAANVCDWAISGVPNMDKDPIRLGVDCTCRHPEAQDCDSRDADTVKRLLLPSMNLQGVIPHEIYLLYDLIELDLNSNKLHGQLSQGILLLRSLRYFSLHLNRLTGSIPDWLGDMVELREINMASNTFTGSLPLTMSKLENLIMLNLSDNQLTGQIGFALERTSRLEALFLGDNDFDGPFLPQYLGFWPVLRVLDVSDNMLGHAIPGNLFDHETLRVVDFHGNALTGPIPEVSNDSMIEFLALQENELVGSIPHSISKLQNMYHLDLSNNNLTGELPMGLSALKQLEYLFLAFNTFESGNIPHFLSSMSNLKDLSLQRTQRTGRIPPVLGELSNLVLLDLGDNSLTGQIPGALGDISDLHYLILYRNHLTGAVPSELHQLDKLQKLVVHDNSITERADYMCTPPQPSLTDFVMECDKDPNSEYPYCPCCKCCIDSDVNCNTLVWFDSLEPAWDTEYVRTHYKFHANDIPYIVSGH